MTEQIRLRRYTDGQVMLNFGTHPHLWRIFQNGSFTGSALDEPTGPGWSELLVAELPEPDGAVEAVDSDGEDTKTPYWKTSWGESVTAWIEGVETPVWELQEDLDAIRSDALKMLAAVAACERYRAERETA